MNRYNIGVDPGRMRHLVTLLEPTQTTGISGVKTVFAAGSPPTTAYAEIVQMSGKEVLRDGLDASQQYFRLTMRFDARFSGNKRVLTPNGDQYVIQSVNNIKERNAYMELTCLGVGDNT